MYIFNTREIVLDSTTQDHNQFKLVDLGQIEILGFTVDSDGGVGVLNIIYRKFKEANPLLAANDNLYQYVVHVVTLEKGTECALGIACNYLGSFEFDGRTYLVFHNPA